MDTAIVRIREHLSVGEIVAAAGALVILAVTWLLFGFVFGHFGTWPPDLVLLMSAALLGVLAIHRFSRHEVGAGYRLLVVGLCFGIGLLAALSLLKELRSTVSGGSFDIGGLTWWAGAVLTVIGGWLVWREEP